MNTEKLTKLIVDCQTKLDEGTQDYWHQPELVDGGWIILNPGGSVQMAMCENEANARNIAALHNGFRKQLKVARKELAWIEEHSRPRDVYAAGVWDAIRDLLTPMADALGVEYDS